MTDDPAVRVEALEALLVEKGLVDPELVDDVIAHYETNVGPLNGAKVVARAWAEPAFHDRLLADGTAAIAEMGYGGAEGHLLIAVENTPAVHNVVVCTLCSCYPWPVLGLPPRWYKSPEYRSRMVAQPRAVLAEMGLELADDVRVTTCACACGTARPRRATWSCPSGRRARRGSARRSSSAWSRGTR